MVVALLPKVRRSGLAHLPDSQIRRPSPYLSSRTCRTRASPAPSTTLRPGCSSFFRLRHRSSSEFSRCRPGIESGVWSPRPARSASTASSAMGILPLSNTPDPCPQTAFHRLHQGSNKSSSLATLEEFPDKITVEPWLRRVASETTRDIPHGRTWPWIARLPPGDRRGTLL